MPAIVLKMRLNYSRIPELVNKQKENFKRPSPYLLPRFAGRGGRDLNIHHRGWRGLRRGGAGIRDFPAGVEGHGERRDISEFYSPAGREADADP